MTEFRGRVRSVEIDTVEGEIRVAIETFVLHPGEGDLKGMTASCALGTTTHTITMPFLRLHPPMSLLEIAALQSVPEELRALVSALVPYVRQAEYPAQVAARQVGVPWVGTCGDTTGLPIRKVRNAVDPVEAATTELSERAQRREEASFGETLPPNTGTYDPFQDPQGEESA